MPRKRSKKPEKIDAAATQRVSTFVFGEDKEVVDQDVKIFQVEPAYVRAAAGVTKNLGNYESLRVDVSISVPCYVENIEDTYLAAADKVSQLLDDEVKFYTGEGN